MFWLRLIFVVEHLLYNIKFLLIHNVVYLNLFDIQLFVQQANHVNVIYVHKVTEQQYVVVELQLYYKV